MFKSFFLENYDKNCVFLQSCYVSNLLLVYKSVSRYFSELIQTVNWKGTLCKNFAQKLKEDRFFEKNWKFCRHFFLGRLTWFSELFEDPSLWKKQIFAKKNRLQRPLPSNSVRLASKAPLETFWCGSAKNRSHKIIQKQGPFGKIYQPKLSPSSWVRGYANGCNPLLEKTWVNLHIFK